jgi:hypothetical protein
VPRPFALEPPLGWQTHHAAGHTYRFGLTLFGAGASHLPYAIVGLQDLAAATFGLRADRREGAGATRDSRARGSRDSNAGRVRLARVEAFNPFTGGLETVYADLAPGAAGGQAARSAGPARSSGVMVRPPNVPVTHADVLARAARWHGRDRVSLRLLTPLSLAAKGTPVREVRPDFPGFFFRRLGDRLEALAVYYGGAAAALGAAGAAALGALGDGVRVVDDRTHWVALQSYSSRQERLTPLGGLLGNITFGAAPEVVAALLPWLVWGEVTHAGKEATRGNGWYRLLEPSTNPAREGPA